MEIEQSQSSDRAPAADVGTTALANSASADGRPDPAASMRPTHPHGNRKSVPCRFYATKKGCRSGDTCPYRHVAPSPGNRVSTEPETPTTIVTSPTTSDVPGEGASEERGSLQAAPSHRPRSVAKKPVSKAQRDSPRDFQIGQLTRRFHPKTEKDDDSGTTLSFGMAPTDPDFPFDLSELLCVLHVPKDWPSVASARPKLKVTNPEMPRGFQINVEKGFDGLVEDAVKEKRQVTLLSLMNSLDKHLEGFLTAEKAPTIKIVANLGNPAGTTPVPPPHSSRLESESSSEKTATEQTYPAPGPAIVQKPITVQYSPEEHAQAEKTRSSETRQLEARLNRLPLYQKSSDGLSYTVPVNPGKREQLSASLKSIKTVKLVVPSLYPLESSSVELPAVDDKESRAVEIGFQKWVQQGPHVTLMSQVNYLAHNMHVLVNTPVSDSMQESRENVDKHNTGIPADSLSLSQTEKTLPGQKQDAEAEGVDTERPHLKFIPRPPEWSNPNTGPGTSSDSDESSTESSESHDEEDGDDDHGGGAPIPESATTDNKPPARGTALNFPGLELFGIEILETTMLSVTVKCERCKEHTDIKNIKPTTDPSAVSPVRVESCRKCANSFNIAFRRELMHPTSQRAGYLDLEGCTAFDLLPSNFQPTCSECSTSFPAPGLVAVRGTSAVATCRECHRKMNFKIPEVKFMVVGPSSLTHHRLAAPRRKKENLGIVAGQELPRRGRCAHYGKSYRWFRFSCCAKVFPCDRCHDAATDHPNEHANRMICGFCSREQIYRPEDCAICRNVLVGKAGSGFWEGGKGTRDKVKMSRKDPRKYKRR